jgi:ribosomal protein S18 acetylase RimI-like enzyme
MATTSPVTAEVRRLIAADWPALREARLTALAEAPYAFASTLERELGFDELTWRHRLDSTAHFGACQPGSAGLVGLVAGFPEPATGSADSAPGQDEIRGWHLVSMWVGPQARGQGIAGRLVTAICDLARAQGADQVALWVTDANLRAQAFYRRAGFRGTGERQPVRPSEPDHLEERMVRVLR